MTPPPPAEAPSRARVLGVDAARGLAALAMVQGHAFDSSAAPEARRGALWFLETQLQSLALPAFLILAGASFALRVRGAAAKGEAPTLVRHAVIRRGVLLLVAGYALSTFSALVDGAEGLETILRADVLHVIGLSLITLALTLRSDARGATDERSFVPLAWLLATVPLLACAWLSPLGALVEGPLRYVVALFVDVPGVTRMPYVPLVSWAAGGALVAHHWVGREHASSAAGAPPRALALLIIGALALALALTQLEHLAVGTGILTRAHPAVILNGLQLFARGLLVLGAGMAIVTRLPSTLRGALLRLGRGSLVAYVFHVPLAYGRLASPVAGQLSLHGALLFAVALELLSFGAVVAWDALKRALASRRAIRADR